MHCATARLGADSPGRSARVSRARSACAPSRPSPRTSRAPESLDIEGERVQPHRAFRTGRGLRVNAQRLAQPVPRRVTSLCWCAAAVARWHAARTLGRDRAGPPPGEVNMLRAHRREPRIPSVGEAPSACLADSDLGRPGTRARHWKGQRYPICEGRSGAARAFRWPVPYPPRSSPF